MLIQIFSEPIAHMHNSFARARLSSLEGWDLAKNTHSSACCREGENCRLWCIYTEFVGLVRLDSEEVMLDKQEEAEEVRLSHSIIRRRRKDT